MSSRVRAPEVTVLPISRGDTITVKKHQTAGEFRDYARAQYVLDANGVQSEANPIDIGLAKILGYLLDWTLTDHADKPIVIWQQPTDVVASALNAIEPECYQEILEAIKNHDVAMRKLRTEKKTDQAGEATSSPISASPSDAAGVTNGSPSSILTSTTS